MKRLVDVARYVRSKNAGPFWVTLDVFCDTDEDYAIVVRAPALHSEAIAERYGVPVEHVRRFELPQLRVLKLSFPRAASQGSTYDRDCHAAQLFAPLLDVPVDAPAAH